MTTNWIAERCFERMRERQFRDLMDHPPECTLADLRRSCRRTQEGLAGSLGVRQLAVSRVERRRDIRVQTLRSYVEALGGRLDLVVRLDRRAVRVVLAPPSR